MSTIQEEITRIKNAASNIKRNYCYGGGLFIFPKSSQTPTKIEDVAAVFNDTDLHVVTIMPTSQGYSISSKGSEIYISLNGEPSVGTLPSSYLVFQNSGNYTINFDSWARSEVLVTLKTETFDTLTTMSLSRGDVDCYSLSSVLAYIEF